MTDDDLDATDGAVVDGFRRVGDTWCPVRLVCGCSHGGDEHELVDGVIGKCLVRACGCIRWHDERQVDAGESVPRAALAVVDSATVDHQKALLEHYRAPNTRKAYSLAWRAFASWCSARALEPKTAGADGNVLAHYFAELHGGLGGRRPACLSSLQVAFAGISVALHGPGEKRPRPAAVRVLFESIARADRLRKSNAKAPLRLLELSRAVATCDESLRGRRDRAILLLGWDGGFRESELVALEVSDLSFEGADMTAHVRASKTDQTGKGLFKAIHAARDPLLCAVGAVRAWLSASGIVEGPLFRGIPRSGTVTYDKALHPQEVRRIVKRRCEAAGLSPKSFGGHSLRSGCATENARAGSPIDEIMAQLGHTRADTTIRYIREATVLQRNIGRGLK